MGADREGWGRRGGAHTILCGAKGRDRGKLGTLRQRESSIESEASREKEASVETGGVKDRDRGGQREFHVASSEGKGAAVEEAVWQARI